MYHYPTYEEWYAGLDSETREKADRMVAKLKELGASDAESWVRSELSENIAQSMRYLALREFCRAVNWTDENIANFLMAARQYAAEGEGDYRDDAGRALQQLDAAGVDQQELAPIFRYAAYEALFALIDVLDEGGSWEHRDMAGWRLMEVDPEEYEPTGRDINCLHESLLEVMHDQGMKVNP